MADAHTAHVLDADGVTPIKFIRHPDGWTNTEATTIKPGGMLDFGNGMTLTNGQALSFSYTIETDLR